MKIKTKIKNMCTACLRSILLRKMENKERKIKKTKKQTNERIKEAKKNFENRMCDVHFGSQINSVMMNRQLMDHTKQIILFFSCQEIPNSMYFLKCIHK